MKKFILLICIYLVFTACDSHDHSEDTRKHDTHAEDTHDHDTHSNNTHSQNTHSENEHNSEEDSDDHGHSHSNEEEHAHSNDENDVHDHEESMVAFTEWTNNLEIFGEYNPLSTEEASNFRIHLTNLENHKPVEHLHGEIVLKYSDGTEIDAHLSMVQPGIFSASLAPTKTGIADLSMIFDLHDYTDEIQIKDQLIYATCAIAEKNVPAHSEPEISFLKEQAWKIDFESTQAKLFDISEVISTSGELIPAPGDEIAVIAETEGFIKFNRKYTLEGLEISKGSNLFTIQSAGIENNLNSKFEQARSEYIKDKAELERAKKLLEKEFISESQFQEYKTNFVTAKTNFEAISKNYRNGEQLIISPVAGFIKELNVDEGEYVEAGDRLATISLNKNILIRADLTQKYYNKIPEIKSASFKSVHSDKYFDTELLNGKIISYGKTHSSNHHFIPVYFEIENIPAILPGTFLEIILKLNKKENTVIIPVNALIEEFGSYSVIVQTGGESFEKRQVKLGIFDGFNYEIISGIKVGERIVTKGNYQIKMASVSSSTPAHTH